MLRPTNIFSYIQTVDGRFSDSSGVLMTYFDHVYESVINVELCKNLKHIGFFTHIINICLIFTAMREMSFRGRVSVRVCRNA